MLVSTRISLVVMVVAAACAAPGAMSGDDDEPGEDVRLQCNVPLACPAPSSATKQTICGQLYDLETGAMLRDAAASACTTIAESGPCSLGIEVYDAISFADNSATTTPLTHGAVEIDGCGRFVIPDIDVNAIGPFVGLAIDDPANPGPTGSTVTVAIAARKSAGTATDGVEAWVVKESTTTQWTSTGGPALSGGVFVPMFRAHKLGTPDTDPFEPQSGVTFTSLGSTQEFYFEAETMPRTTVDTAAVATGVNGTVLVSSASIHDGATYSGSGGLDDPDSCRWSIHPGMSQPYIVFVQIFRPLDQVGFQCSL